MKQAVSIVLTAVFLLPAVATAQRSIGVHFPSNRDNARVAPDEVAGFQPQANWNSADGADNGAGGLENLGNNDGDTSNISSPFPEFLVDSNGDIAANEETEMPTSVSWQSNGTWNTTNSTGTPDHKLLNGYIDAFSNADSGFDPGVRITFNDIPYQEYDVIVYVGTDGNDREGNMVYCAQAQCDDDDDFQIPLEDLEEFADADAYRQWSTATNFGDGVDIDWLPVLTDDPTGGRDRGNLLFFSELEGPTATFEIVNWTTGNNNGIHAIQIFERDVPPPAIACDFDNTQTCTVDDIDGLLYNGIANNDLAYDMDGSGTVDADDITAWLADAGTRNIGRAYDKGDSDLDGDVDSVDLNNVGVNWQVGAIAGGQATSWGQGDFDGDGDVDSVNLNDVGVNWQNGVAAPAATVPEPSGLALLLIGALVGLSRRRRRRG